MPLPYSTNDDLATIPAEDFPKVPARAARMIRVAADYFEAMPFNSAKEFASRLYLMQLEAENFKLPSRRRRA